MRSTVGAAEGCDLLIQTAIRQETWLVHLDGVLRSVGHRVVVHRLQPDARHARTRHCGDHLDTVSAVGVALVIALGFEFVNGFHDTANAVATVIYTHSLPPNFAVVWSGFFNFLGVLLSSGAVAFGIIALLPVELILQVGSSAGFAMIFALLIAAILWNLGTWWLGLPASSSHTLIGSIIGVGVANALMHGRDGTSGVDWAQATKIGYALLLSPLVGFACAALLLLALRAFVKNRALYKEPC
jgi:PiT family inorganic phosphate transporter